jgi:hypothetical protein
MLSSRRSACRGERHLRNNALYNRCATELTHPKEADEQTNPLVRDAMPLTRAVGLPTFMLTCGASEAKSN